MLDGCCGIFHCPLQAIFSTFSSNPASLVAANPEDPFFAWVFMCFLRWSDLVNRFPHSLQANLFSPVCVLRWRCSSSDLVKDLLQNTQPHVKGRSPACHLRCAFKCDVLPYTFSQPGTWHKCCLFLPPSYFRTFSGLFQDLLRPISRLSQDFLRIFFGLSQNFLRTFGGSVIFKSSVIKLI